MGEELETLKPDPEAAPELKIELATRLLNPETTATFGAKRVRDAMMACAEVLADEPAADSVVGKMMERARLAGAPHVDCLRIEARVFMAAGDFTSGYARWLQVIDSEEGEIRPADYLQAARCVIEDMQPDAAIELLTRAKKRFPTDSGFALEAASMLLTSGHGRLGRDARAWLHDSFAGSRANGPRDAGLRRRANRAQDARRSPSRADQAEFGLGQPMTS